MLNDYSKSADFQMENGWDAIPMPERRAFRAKIYASRAFYRAEKEKVMKAANARHQRKRPQIERILFVVLGVLLIAILLLLSFSCQPVQEAKRRNSQKQAIRNFNESNRRPTRVPMCVFRPR